MKRVELTIEKLIYGGDGLARITSTDGGARAKTVFVPYVLPGEQVEVGITEERPGFARARLERVLQASHLRSLPPCPYFGRCGGCHYQHTSYDEQLRFKSEILLETLRRVAKLDLPMEIQTHPSLPLNYRNRTRFHMRPHPYFAAGYFHHGSHELLPVHECPISSPLLNSALKELWRVGEAGKVPAAISEIEFFANENEERLMVELYVRLGDRGSDALAKFAHHFTAAVPETYGIATLSRSNSRVPSQQPAEVLYGQPTMTYVVSGETYQVSAGSFFQTNRHLVSRMVQLAIGDRTGKLALDLYSGVGLFAVPLARHFERVIAVESFPASSTNLRANVPENVKVSGQSTEIYLQSVAGKLKPDLVLVDPPRAGLGPAVCKQIEKLKANEVVYVSCDPATLSRDLKQLTAAGLKIAEIHFVDLFPQTFHIESITLLHRS
ncbi:MAG TPA: 23S rRNA (uracil(1939)-C(5))-methyltransferase RlmD [Terriglobales bacterium]|nr:23S rRNA (uracil(1939)-C(5))-methyltransferase RlmD [Terriglobales bacterium]